MGECIMAGVRDSLKYKWNLYDIGKVEVYCVEHGENVQEVTPGDIIYFSDSVEINHKHEIVLKDPIFSIDRDNLKAYTVQSRYWKSPRSNQIYYSGHVNLYNKISLPSPAYARLDHYKDVMGTELLGVVKSDISSLLPDDAAKDERWCKKQ